MIKIFKFLGSSLAALYIVCAGFLVMSVSADNSVVAEPTPAVVEIKAEAMPESNIVSDALDAQPKWMQLAANLIAFAAAIAAVVPGTSPRTNAILKGLRWLVDVGALNIFNARNEKPRDNYLK